MDTRQKQKRQDEARQPAQTPIADAIDRHGSRRLGVGDDAGAGGGAGNPGRASGDRCG